jgi:hypothetical protein
MRCSRIATHISLMMVTNRLRRQYERKGRPIALTKAFMGGGDPNLGDRISFENSVERISRIRDALRGTFCIAGNRSCTRLDVWMSHKWAD